MTASDDLKAAMAARIAALEAAKKPKTEAVPETPRAPSTPRAPPRPRDDAKVERLEARLESLEVKVDDLLKVSVPSFDTFKQIYEDAHGRGLKTAEITLRRLYRSLYGRSP